jgi:NADPH:quinone reductase-like Zn-dependent oxidoreductase
MGAQPLGYDDWVDGTARVEPFDVIIELVGGASIERGVPSLALRGTLVVVGVPLGTEVSISVRPLMSNRAALIGTGLRRRPLEQKAAAVDRFAHEVVPLLGRGAVRPVIDSVFPFTAAEDAFARLDSPGKRGKVLLEFPES